MDQKRIGAFIAQCRREKNLTQMQLAGLLGITSQAVSKWENGLSVPDSSMLVSLAEELDISVSTLLGEVVQEESLNEGNLKSISEKLELINLTNKNSKPCKKVPATANSGLLKFQVRYSLFIAAKAINTVTIIVHTEIKK